MSDPRRVEAAAAAFRAALKAYDEWAAADECTACNCDRCRMDRSRGRNAR